MVEEIREAVGKYLDYFQKRFQFSAVSTKHDAANTSKCGRTECTYLPTRTLRKALQGCHQITDTQPQNW
jgi:hypothetical protein